MPSFCTSTVERVLVEREGLQRVALAGGRRAYVLTALVGPVAAGDRVVVNTTAVDLGLGTGGWDVVHWNLSRDSWSRPGPGHIMKLRYTSLQADTGAAEEQPGYESPQDLGGMPVVVCALHSQVACVAAAFAEQAPGRRLVYVMTDGGALPLALSDLVASLRAAGMLASTVTAGHAFGGDLEAVTAHSALGVARREAGADAVVVAPGPGVVGTGTAAGFTATEVASIVDFAGRDGARPGVALRYSDADPRRRHRGVSHHSVTALAYAHEPAVVPVPAGQPFPEVHGHPTIAVAVPDVPALLARAGLRVTSMGRTPEQDPLFYAYAGAAGTWAGSVLEPAA